MICQWHNGWNTDKSFICYALHCNHWHCFSRYKFHICFFEIANQSCYQETVIVWHSTTGSWLWNYNHLNTCLPCSRIYKQTDVHFWVYIFFSIYSWISISCYDDISDKVKSNLFIKGYTGILKTSEKPFHEAKQA